MLNIKISRCLVSNSIEFNYQDESLAFSHKICSEHFPATLNDDAIALVALFMRPKNSQNYQIRGVDVSINILQWINNNIGITDANVSNISPLTLKTRFMLAFSGGFDSIAVYYLLKNNFSHELVSVDYGGAFAREALFFKKFPTLVVSSDIRRQNVRFNESTDWRFLISPLMTLADKCDSVAVLTGTIMEASPFWFSGKHRKFSNTNSVLGPGFSVFSPLACITEYGTTLIASNVLTPEQFDASLTSLASNNSFKRYRKQVLSSCVSGVEPPSLPSNIKKHTFGSSFGEDIVSLYVLWKLGKSFFNKNYCTTNIQSFDIDMSYFEKINTENLKILPKDIANLVNLKLNELGFKEMNLDDMINIEKTYEFLNSYKTNNASRQ